MLSLPRAVSSVNWLSEYPDFDEKPLKSRCVEAPRGGCRACGRCCAWWQRTDRWSTAWHILVHPSGSDAGQSQLLTSALPNSLNPRTPAPLQSSKECRTPCSKRAGAGATRWERPSTAGSADAVPVRRRRTWIVQRARVDPKARDPALYNQTCTTQATLAYLLFDLTVAFPRCCGVSLNIALVLSAH